jgi:hypothetical protein
VDVVDDAAETSVIGSSGACPAPAGVMISKRVVSSNGSTPSLEKE